MTRPFKKMDSPRTGVLLLPLALACALAACDRSEPVPDTGAAAPDTAATPPDPNGPTAVPATTGAGTDSALPGTSPDDANAAAEQGEALALLVAVNEHEIAAAEQARSKQVDGDVLEYADLMHREHSQNLAQTQALGPAQPDSSEDVLEQQAKGQAELDALAKLTGDAYEDAYVEAMVKGHDEALKLLDTRLIPAAQDPAVIGHFKTTREHVAAHLEKAKALQDE